MPNNVGSFLKRYGCAAVSIALATWVRLLLDPALGFQFPFATLFFAILLTAWYGGFRPALVAVVLGGLASTWFILPPRGSFALQGWDQQVGMVLYSGTSLGIALLGGVMHSARRGNEATAQAEHGQTNDRVATRVLEHMAELAQTNESLQTTEERFRLLIEGVQEFAIFMLDSTGHVMTWNPGAQRSKGYRAEEIIGHHFSCFYPEEDIAQGKPEHLLLRTLAEGSCEDEGWRVRKDGSRFWARVVITALYDKAGQRHGFAKVTRDISTGVRAQERFGPMVESVLNALVMVNPEGKIVLVNAQTERLFGYPQDELVGQPLELLVPERFRSRHLEYRSGFFANPRVRSMGIGRDLHGRRKDGSEFPVEIGLNPIKTDEGLMVLSTIVDITERKQMEWAIRDSEERFRMMANSIPQLAWMARADGYIFWYNRRWFEFTGTTPQQMEGWGWQSVHDPQVLPTVMERWKHAIDAGMPFDMVFPLRGADGQFRAFLTRVEPFKDSEGRVLQWFGTNTDVEELTRLEESLRASQTRLNSTLAAGSIGTWSWDIVSDRLTADEFTARMFSIEPDAAAEGLPAKDYLRAIVEEDQPRVAEAFACAIHSCGHYDIEFQIRAKQGEFRWLHAKGWVEGDAAGNASHFHGAVIDISESKRAEEALRDSEQRLRLFIEYAPAALAMFDLEMRYLAASRRWLADYGFPDGDLAGRSHYDVFPEVPETWKSVHRRGLAGEVVRADEDRFVRADGRVLWLKWEVRPWRRADGAIGGIVIFTEDVTDRKLTEERLHLQGTALEAAGNGIVITSRDGDIVWVNPAFTRMTGYSPAEVLGKNPRILNSGKHARPFFDSLWHTIQDGKVWHGEVINRRKDGSLYTEEMTITPVRASGAGITHFVAIKQDITDRKRGEQVLQWVNADLERGVQQLADANRELKARTQETEAFVHSVSHDLRAPLVNLQGFSKELARAVQDLRSYLEKSSGPQPGHDCMLGGRMMISPDSGACSESTSTLRKIRFMTISFRP